MRKLFLILLLQLLWPHHADSLKNAFTPLVRLKQMKGLRVKVESIEDILAMPCQYTQPQEKLKWHLYKLYENNGLQWCLLGG